MLSAHHPCPGGCGRDGVAWDRFACAACWQRLPARLCLPITVTFGRRNMGAEGRDAHHAAMLAAQEWFRCNPPTGEPAQ